MTIRRLVIAMAFLGGVLPCSWAIAPAAAQEDVSWEYVRVEAPRQTVEVTSRTGTYTAEFRNEAIVDPSGRARGSLAITKRDGALVRYRVVAGRVRSNLEEVAEVRLLVRRVGADPGDEFDIVVIRPDPEMAECLIYDFVGPAFRLHFEAQGRIELIRF